MWPLKLFQWWLRPFLLDCFILEEIPCSAVAIVFAQMEIASDVMHSKRLRLS
jgi:hypothetical protein